MTTNEQMKARVRALINMGITQKALAAKLDETSSTIGRWLKGEQPSLRVDALDALNAFEKALRGVSFETVTVGDVGVKGVSQPATVNLDGTASATEGHTAYGLPGSRRQPAHPPREKGQTARQLQQIAIKLSALAVRLAEEAPANRATSTKRRKLPRPPLRRVAGGLKRK